jgi:transcription elongation factor Elf1
MFGKGKLMEDLYTEMSCPNCESQYAVDYVEENVNGEVEYCPFCGEEIPEDVEEDFDKEEEKDSAEGSW